MPSLKLTQRAVAALPAPDPSGRQTLYLDTEVKGFGVLVSGKTTSKSWIVQRDVRGRTLRRTLGSIELMKAEDAREEAKEKLRDLSKGVDPRAEKKKAEARDITLRKAFNEFLKHRPRLRPKSRQDYTDSLRHLESWLDKPLTSITKEMVEERHSKIAEEVAARRKGATGASSANGAMRTLRAVWNYMELPACPVKLKKQWHDEPRRTTYVKLEDLPKFHAAVQSLDNTVARDYLLLLLYTGLRRRAAAALTWKDVDFIARVITIPEERTGTKRRALTLPMSDLVFDLLKARREIGDAGYVFPSSAKSKHIEEPKFALNKVAEACGILVSAHDLRRTFSTVARMVAGVDGLPLKALMGHSPGRDVTEGYIMVTVENLREPAQRIADKLKVLCGIKKQPLRRRKPRV